MPRGIVKQPAPETFVAEHQETGAKLYAELAPVPLYANARIIIKNSGIGKRQSFYLGWLIGEQRLARGRDSLVLPQSLQDWVAEHLAELYPDHETASGLTADEVAELEHQQAQKRKQYQN